MPPEPSTPPRTFNLGGQRILSMPGVNLFLERNTGAANLNPANGETFVGFRAGTANTTGIRNVFVGALAGTTNTAGGSNTFNGATQDSAVGIGTTNPQEKLDVIGGNIFIGSNGRGLILRSPSGNVCRRLSIDDNGNLLTVGVACPAVIVQ